MDYQLDGMRMDRRRMKELQRMGKKTVNGLTGLIMDRRVEKKLTRI